MGSCTVLLFAKAKTTYIKILQKRREEKEKSILMRRKISQNTLLLLQNMLMVKI